jgi:hypothetical protein
MRPRRIARWFALGLAPAAAVVSTFASFTGCGNASAPNPFDTGDAGSDAQEEDGATGGAGGGSADAGGDADPTLGGPCVDDAQCNDAIACTYDTCDMTLGRCRNTPDDSQCQDGIYCNGMEVCELLHGCVPGAPITCSTGDACMIGTCVEATQSCTHTLKDADQDGDPDWHCDGGHDCNDNDPNVSSKVPEVCANGIDDNCNGKIDEMPCVAPANSTCADPLVISASGTYAISTLGSPDAYMTSCGLGSNMATREAVAAIVVPAGPPVDVEVTAEAASADVSIAIAGQCGDPSTELACCASFSSAMGGQISRVRGHALGSASMMTAYPVYVQTSVGSAVSLDVQFLPVGSPDTNLTCGTAEPITLGTPVAAEILDQPTNVGTACMTPLGQLLYSFTLSSTADVTLYATSTDGTGEPVVSLRDPGCALPSDEITCTEAASVRVFEQSMAAGTYYVALSASAPTAIELTVEASAPTTPAADQFCTGAPVLTPNKTIPVQLSTHEAVTNLGCLPGAASAAYELDLAAASDVLLVERIASGDTGSVGLATPACTASSALLCNAGSPSPVRGSKRNVAPGSYRVVAESLNGDDVELTAFVRDSVPPTLVTFAAGCSQPFVIPETGGFFQGNTANSTPNFPAGCDVGNVTGNGAPDQLLTFTLATTQRVVFDMEGSGYNTILDVRQGPSCPGTEMANACAVGFPPWHSYLDLTLDAGTYFIQIDGYDYAEGPWFLDVRVVDP